MARKTRPRGHNSLTLLIVPDPTQSPITLRVPTWFFPLLLALVVALFGGMAIYAVNARMRIDQLQARLAQEDQVRDVSQSREQEMRTAILSQRDEAKNLKQEYATLTQDVQTFQSDVNNQVQGMQADVNTEVDRIKAGMQEIDRLMGEIRGIVGLQATPTPAPSGEAQPGALPLSQVIPGDPVSTPQTSLDTAPILGSLDDGLGGDEGFGGTEGDLAASLDMVAFNQNRNLTLSQLQELDAQIPAKLAELQQLKEAVIARVEKTDPSKRSSPAEIEQQLRLIDAAPKGWPAGGSITSTFGWRRWGRYKEFHTGLDIGMWYRTPVRVQHAGVIVFSGWQSGYGWSVEIKHDMGYSTLYGHLSRTTVDVGQEVAAGDTIGLSGSSGRSTGPHLHYEIRLNGVPVDPMKFVNMQD